jgi:hypothetical protein
MYAKALENLDFADDDVDVWGLHANAKISTFTIGAYGLLFRMNTYPFYVAQTGPFGLTGSVADTRLAALNPSIPGTFKSHMWWWGGYVDGKAGPVNLNYDFVYDYGSVDERQSFGPQYHNVKYEGWATRLKVDFPWEKFNFGAVGMYATGSDTRRTSNTGLPGSTTAAFPGAAAGWTSRRVSGYVVPPGSEQGPATGESVLMYGMEGGATGGYAIAENANYGALSRGGFGGTWFAKLYGSMKIAPWYKVTVQGLYIGDTTRHGNTFGNAIKYKVGGAPGILRKDTDIGWELNLINEIQIYNNLRFFIGYGYLIAGDAMDVNWNGLGINRGPSNPWSLRTRLQYTF